jgi:predicted secreted protein
MWRVCLIVLGVGAACGRAQLPVGSPQEPAAKPVRATVAYETYLGMLACDSCAGTRVELALFREGDVLTMGTPAAYHLREIHYGGPDGEKVVDKHGVWIEQVGPPGHGAVLELSDGDTPQDRQHFERVALNGGELVLLDASLHELPADLPHTLTRVTGDHQLHVTTLTDADDGRTIEFKPGEVFLVRLRTKVPAGYEWISDRPEGTVLLETGATPAAGEALPKPATVAKGVAPGKAVPGRSPGNANAAAEFQVWQLIAPQPGVLALHFQYRKVGDETALPMKLFSVTVLTR